jgi:hypothetical protein
MTGVITPSVMLVLAHLAFRQLSVCTFALPQGVALGAADVPQCAKGDVLTDQSRVSALKVDADGTVIGAAQVPCRRLRPA